LAASSGGLLPIELVRPKDPAGRDTGLLREDHFGEVTGKGREDMETTEITEKIKDHRSGKITAEELVKYLSEDARYKPGPVNPHESGTPEWWRWSEDGPPFVPGSFAEVELARDNGLLDPDIYEQVLHVFYSRQDKS
jgi:hypothetical protein